MRLPFTCSFSAPSHPIPVTSGTSQKIQPLSWALPGSQQSSTYSASAWSLHFPQQPQQEAPLRKKPQILNQSKVGAGRGRHRIQFFTGRETSKSPSDGSNIHNRIGISSRIQGMAKSHRLTSRVQFSLGGCSPGRLTALWSGWNRSVTNMLVLSYLQSAWGPRSGMRERELQTVRFPSLHLRYIFFWPAGRPANAPSMAGSDGVPVECSNAEWHHKAELESFVSILWASNPGEEQGKLQASTRTLNYTFIKPPTGICKAPRSSEHCVIKTQRRHHHLWPSKHPCSTSQWVMNHGKSSIPSTPGAFSS